MPWLPFPEICILHSVVTWNSHGIPLPNLLNRPNILIPKGFYYTKSRQRYQVKTRYPSPAVVFAPSYYPNNLKSVNSTHLSATEPRKMTDPQKPALRRGRPSSKSPRTYATAMEMVEAVTQGQTHLKITDIPERIQARFGTSPSMATVRQYVSRLGSQGKLVYSAQGEVSCCRATGLQVVAVVPPIAEARPEDAPIIVNAQEALAGMLS